MAELTIQLLGQFQVRVGGKIISGFASDKVRALLAYLVAEVQFPHRREILADLLWPEKPELSARGNLRRALANLRQVLNDQNRVSPILLVSRKDIQFNQKSDSWVDVNQLNQIYELREVTSENIAHFKGILDVYKGEFLAGFSLKNNLPFEEWGIMLREQYARKAIKILKQVSNYYEKRGDFISALPFAWRHVELERWQEGARRQLMRLLVKTGRRDEALQQFENLSDILESELGISPESKTKRLYEQIKNGEQIDIGIIIENKSVIKLPGFFKLENYDSLVESDIFVAREAELEALNSLLKSVLVGQGRIALVGGEAGSGKSTLVREFIRRAQMLNPNLVSATGYCNAFTGSGDPYLPFREILNQFTGEIETHWRAGAITREYAYSLSQIVPLACEALIERGPDLIDRVVSGSALLANAQIFNFNDSAWFRNLENFIEQQQSSQKGGVQAANLLSQFTAVLREVAKKYPVAIFLDDLQWADAGTLSMLFHLGKNISGSKLMIIGAFRTEEVGLSQANGRHPLLPVINELKRDYGEIIINLDQIKGIDFVKELVQSEPNELDVDFNDQLYTLTRGHALFTVELLRALQDSGILFKSSGGRWKAKQDFNIETLPAKIEGIISERVGRLSQKLLNILTLASVEGEYFTAETIADLENISGNEMIRLLSEVLDKQHRLVRAHQVQVMDGKSISTYRFRHILFQKFLYDRLDEIEQVRFHRRIGESLEKHLGENKVEYAVQLARHFDIAKHVEKALEYHILSGERAMQMAGFPEAIKHIERALNLLKKMPESVTRDAKELGLQLQLGIASQILLGFSHEKVGEAFKRAWDLCQNVGDKTTIITTQQLLFSYYANMADYETAFQIMAFLEEYYDPGNDIHALQLNWGYGYMDHILGKQNRCLERFEKALSFYNPAIHESIGKRIGMEAGIYCNGWAGLYSIWVGYPERGREYIQKALKIAEKYNYAQFTSEAYWFVTWTSIELKDQSTAKTFVEKALEITIRENYYMFEGVIRALLGRILAWEAKYHEAISSIQQGYDMFLVTGAITHQTLFLHALAEVYCAAGEVELGLDTVEKLIQFEKNVGERIYLTAISKIRGDLLLLKGDEAGAEEAYKSSMRMAREESAKLLELEAAKGLALLLEKQGKTEKARQILREVYEWFTEGFDTQALLEAKQILQVLNLKIYRSL